MARRNKPLAHMDHPLIAAVIDKTFRFIEHADAEEKLAVIAKQCITAKDQPEAGLRLWIHSFAVTGEEAEEGYLGHFATITTRQRKEDQTYYLSAEKELVELKYHPQRVRPKQRMPNWGHPTLRRVKAGRVYHTVEEAQEALADLHLEFPHTTIPANNNKLYLMIFSRKDNPKEPVSKYVFEIEVRKEGDFVIVYEKNAYDEAKLPLEPKETPPDEAPKGYFTAKVALKRQRK